jgi:hypothetical protein
VSVLKVWLAADYKADETDKRMKESPIRYIRFIRYQHPLPANIYPF